MNNLREKASKGIKWNAIERVTVLVISFTINIILARLLSPDVYGIISMLAVFISISEVFVKSGFGVALVQNRERSEIDFSTAFFYNIFMSGLFYGLLFISAPFIASFYSEPSLVLIARIIGLNLIIAALGNLQNIKLLIAVDFKTQAKIALTSNLIAGIVSVFLAYKGLGVWVLVVQSVLSTTLMTLLRIYFVRWIPLLVFSKKSFTRLFDYGGKILITTLADVIYNNLYAVIIGKKYSSSDLGYYSRADSLLNLPVTNITSVIENVTFPVLAEIQFDLVRLSNNYRKILKTIAFIVFPLICVVCVLAKPLVFFLLTDKWSSIVPLMQVLGLSYLFYPLNVINVNLLKVTGKTNLLVKLEIIKKIITTIIIFATIPFGMVGLCYGIVISAFITFITNSFFIGKIINLGFIKQLIDLMPVVLLSIIMGVTVFVSSYFFESNFMKLFIGSFLGFVFYLSGAYLLKLEELKELLSIIGLGNVKLKY